MTKRLANLERTTEELLIAAESLVSGWNDTPDMVKKLGELRAAIRNIRKLEGWES